MYKNIKSIIIMCTICFVGIQNIIYAQQPAMISPVASVGIDQCFEWAHDNYPLIRQLDYIEKSSEFNLSNASKGYLPQISLNGQATYQSAVTQFPIELPNVNIPTISKEQFKIYGEMYQPLTNYRQIKDKKMEIQNMGEIEKQQVEIDLYKLKERINQLYFGVLLLEEKMVQLGIIRVDIDSAIVKVRAGMQYGTATQTDLSLLMVEKISINQQISENKANKITYTHLLSALTGKQMDENTKFIKPETETIPSTMNRPELRLFHLQSRSVELQQKNIKNSLVPMVGLFLQGGYGRPALNFLSNDVEGYYIGGLKVNWNFSTLYTYKNNLNLLDLAKDKIEAQKETFLLNTKLIETQQSNEINTYKNLIKTDQEIIQIRNEVLTTAKEQLRNGLITTIDYVHILHEMDKARQTLASHQTQLWLAQHNLKFTTGN